MEKSPIVIDMIETNVAPRSQIDRQIEVASLQKIQEGKERPSSAETDLDQSEVDLLADFNKPNYEQMKKKRDENHARNKYRKPYGCFEACCNFTTGWHNGITTTSESDMDKFGVGMVLYFRFVKYLGCFFFIFTLLSFPSLFFTISASDDFSVKGLTDYKGMLYFTTLGSMKRGVTQCIHGKMNEAKTFSCEKGRLGPLSTFQYGRILEDQDMPCTFLTIYSWDSQCNTNNMQAIEQAYMNCEGAESCSFTLDSSLFDFSRPGCEGWDPTIDPDATFYFKAYCESDEISLPGSSSLSKKTAGIIVATLDAVIFLIYIVMLILLRRMEKKTVSKLEGNINTVDAYTIKVGNLPERNRAFLKKELWKHFSQIVEGDQTLKYNVVDVQLAESQYLLDLQTQLETLRKKKSLLSQRFYHKWSKQAQAKQGIFTDEDLRQLAMQGNEKMIKEYQSIKKLKEQMDKLGKKISHEKNHKETIPSTAFVTFETKEQRDEIYARYQKSPFKRFCYDFCKFFYNKDVNIFHGSYLKVKDAPSTHNILWANVGVSKTERFFRRLVSWVITVGFWAISFGLILIVKAQQEGAFDLVRPTQSCTGYGEITREQAEADNALGSASLGLTECFCRDSLERQLTIGICRDWRTKKLVNEALPFLVIGGIIITNYALQYVFKLLSNFERHQSVSSESSSRVIKIFVAQVLNTGLIILFVNARFTRHRISNVLEGRYDDLTTEWYLNVGTTVLMTMIVNIVNLPVVNILFYLFRSLFKLFDRDCTCNERRTCKETQEDYVNLYTGPEFLVDFRYAQILTMIFICFLYSPGMPLLYPTILLSLLLIYWMDKLFLLKICKLPKMFDDHLENVVRHILYFAMFFHLIFAVWTYGNPEIFDNATSFIKNNELITATQNKEKTYVMSSIKDRAILDHNIVLTILFVGLVVSIVATILFRNTIKRIANFCLRRRVSKVLDENKYSGQKTYFDYIHLEDLQRERAFLYNEINNTKDEELQGLLAKRLEQINKEIRNRDPAEENHLTKFLGPFSYFIGHNDVYKSMFNLKEVKVDHAPSIAKFDQSQN